MSGQNPTNRCLPNSRQTLREMENESSALWKQNMESMLSAIWLERRETDAQIMGGLALLSQTIEKLEASIREMNSRLGLLEERAKEQIYWTESVNRSVERASSAPPPPSISPLGSTTKVKRETRSCSMRMPSPRNRDEPGSPRSLVRQKTSEDLRLKLNNSQNFKDDS